MYRNKMNEHKREFRDVHPNLAMKKVVSVTVTVGELQEKFQQLRGHIQTITGKINVIVTLSSDPPSPRLNVMI